MRILLASYFYPPSIGGVERQSHLLARTLVGRGHVVKVLSARLTGFAAREIIDGVDVERLPAGAGTRWTRMGTYLASLMSTLIRLRREFDLVQVQQALYPAAAAAATQPLLRVPLVVRNSGSGTAGAVQQMRSLPFGTVALRLIASRATTVSLTREMTQELRAAGFSRIVEIPNGVVMPAAPTAEARTRARATLGIAGPLAVYVGRIELGEKDILLLLRAFARVADPSARLVLVGDGGDRARLEAIAAGDVRVRFVGSTATPDIYLRAADLFVLPSRSEGISNALLEAMAHGLPCLATAVGGNRHVLVDSNVGRLIPPGDDATFGEAIADLLARPEEARRVGAQARAHVEKHYSVDVMATAYERLYAELVRGGTARP